MFTKRKSPHAAGFCLVEWEGLEPSKQYLFIQTCVLRSPDSSGRPTFADLSHSTRSSPVRLYHFDYLLRNIIWGVLLMCYYAKCSKGGLSRRFRFGCLCPPLPLKPTFPLVLCGQNSRCATIRSRCTKPVGRKATWRQVAKALSHCFCTALLRFCTPRGSTVDLQTSQIAED